MQYRCCCRAQVYAGQFCHRYEAGCYALAEHDPRLRGRAREDVQLDGHCLAGEIGA
jgi:hypothetical protein